MSLAQTTDYTIDPNTTSGTQLAVILNRLHDAILTRHSDAAPPPYAKAGTIWLDTSTPPGELKWYDGTTWQPLGGGSGLKWFVIAAGTAAKEGEGSMVDTTGGPVTITLPAGTAGDRIGFKDYAQTFDTNNLTITPAAGENIEGQATPLIIDNQGWSGVLEYIDATKGWMLVESSPMGAWGTGSLVPAGGTTGQVLAKKTNNDSETEWIDAGGSRTWKIIAADTAAVAGDALLVDTAAAVVTVTLPAAPALGDEIWFEDKKSNFGTNKLTVAQGGNPIMGLAEDMDVDRNNAMFGLVFADAIDGWRII